MAGRVGRGGARNFFVKRDVCLSDYISIVFSCRPKKVQNKLSFEMSQNVCMYSGMSLPCIADAPKPLKDRDDAKFLLWDHAIRHL